jgi:hypothetical protein
MTKGLGRRRATTAWSVKLLAISDSAYGCFGTLTVAVQLPVFPAAS